MRYRVRHWTTYEYSDFVSLCHNQAHLTPRSDSRQTCHTSDLQITPRPSFMAERREFFGNHVVFFSVQEHHKKLEVLATSDVEVFPFTPPMPEFTPPWEEVRDGLAAEVISEQFSALQFVQESYHLRADEAMKAYALESFTPERPLLEAALELTERIYTDFKYDKSATCLTTSLPEVFEMRKGVCQDFAHLEIACLRSLGLASRYVSGYLLTNPPAGQKRLVGADASHAWLSIYCTGFGWIDLDPTNNCVPSEKHIVLAWGRDYSDVSPIKGVILGGGRHSMVVAVDVEQSNT